MQIVIEVADTKADFVLELLGSLPFVAIQNETVTTQRKETANLSPKTAHLLGVFPQLTDSELLDRVQAVLAKHA
jgi:hypothetical protein